jgi:hypothetical protein
MSKVATLPQNNINLYETPQAIQTSVPYARIDADELSLIIQRFVSLSLMLVTHPATAAKFGELSTTCIQLATDLRNAMKVSQETCTYPDVVLPMNKYFTTMKIYIESRSLDPVVAEMIEQESRWREEDFPSS